VQAGLQYGIPRSTIQDRINGKLPKSEAHQFQQRLSLVQEDRLMQWVLNQETLGLALTHGQIRAFAGRVLYARGDAKPLRKR
jgi:hypothetical protein